MKQIFCLITVLCLILGSFSLCFAADATWSTTDSQNLSNVAGRLYYMNQSAAYYLYNIATNTNNIYNKCVDIYNALFYGNHNITYWVNAISTWMSPIYNSITQIPLDLDKIYYSLGYNTDVDNDGNLEFHPYLSDLNYQLITRIYDYWVPTLGANGTVDHWDNETFPFTYSMFRLLQAINNAIASEYVFNYQYIATGYNSSQTYTNPLTLYTSTFTPTSVTNGLYTWLSKIQEPTARLSYVLASPERIEAQEAAADNEEAVVDNFIDSNGAGSASTSDIGSISDLSSGYKSNFGSDASVTGIFNIFNSNNMGWFSSETYNQLDTTSNNRRTKSGSLPDTPLLNQKINDIYEAIGLDNDR